MIWKQLRSAKPLVHNGDNDIYAANNGNDGMQANGELAGQFDFNKLRMSDF